MRRAAAILTALCLASPVVAPAYDAALVASPAAATLLRAAADARGDALERAVAIARTAIRLRDRSAPPPAFDPASPGDAVRALLAARRTALSPADLAAMRALDALPSGVADPLADLVAAYGGFERAAAARAGVDGARLGMLAAVLRLRAAIRDAPEVQAGTPIRVQNVLYVDLRRTAVTTYRTSYHLLVDGGGNDTYLNNAGGTSFSFPGCSLDESFGIAAALVDLGGADRYGDARDCGANGGALLGAGFLLDAAGNDVYTGGLYGANGGGSFLGNGFLLDAAGNDSYSAYGCGSNGGGCGAIFGFVVPGASGFLLDGGGTDTYLSGSNGVNGGGDAGNGFLFDVAGRDRYTAAHYGANGGAFGEGFMQVLVPATGFLLDGGGPDTYGAGEFGTNGGGLDGRGALVDAGGDDSYLAGGFLGGVAVNGGGPPSAVTSQGVGLLLDLAGLDRYLGSGAGVGTDCTVAPKGAFGAQVDAPNTDC